MIPLLLEAAFLICPGFKNGIYCKSPALVLGCILDEAHITSPQILFRFSAHQKDLTCDPETKSGASFELDFCREQSMHGNRERREFERSGCLQRPPKSAGFGRCKPRSSPAPPGGASMSKIRVSRSDTKRAGSGSGELDPEEIASVARQTKAVAESQAVTEAATNRRAASKKKPNKTKSALIVGLLKRRSGASLEELQRSSGWQAHSVRGFSVGDSEEANGPKGD